MSEKLRKILVVAAGVLVISTATVISGCRANISGTESDRMVEYTVICGDEIPETGGYSITVNQFYVKDKAMYFDTRLIAPDKGEKVSNQASYPYIVIKTELSEMPVVFE